MIVSLKVKSFFMITMHLSGLIGTGMEGDFCYMSVRTYRQKFYTVIFLLLKVFLLRLFSIRKDG